MKILHLESALLGLHQFGIQIPMTDGRVRKVLEHLKQQRISFSENADEIRVTKDDILRAHDNEYVTKLFGTQPEIEKAIADTFELITIDGQYHRYDPNSAQLPLKELWQRMLMQTTGTLAVVQEALKSGESFFLGGGFHHAMSFAGRGFCLINDIVIAARWAQQQLGAKLVWVIDVDAHKGDGTAQITRDDPSIKTLSIHMQEGWPMDSGPTDAAGNQYPWFIASDVDIDIAEGEDDQFNARLEAGLLQLEKISGEVPSLAIVVQGSDPYEKDQLPSSQLLKLTSKQLLERDLLVYNFLKQRGIPQAYVMSGGYGEHAHEIYCQFLSAI